MIAAKRCIHQEVPKKLVIVVANAVVDEGAVMIHPHDALIANFAMMGPRRLYLFAFVTVPVL